MNLLMWFLLGSFVNWLLGSMADSEIYLRIGMDVNIKVNMENLATYLHVVELGDEEFIFEEGKHTWRRVIWQETNLLKWEGTPPKVYMIIDWTYGWMLRVTIQYNSSQGKMNRKEIKKVFFEELMEAGVIERP